MAKRKEVAIEFKVYTDANDKIKQLKQELTLLRKELKVQAQEMKLTSSEAQKLETKIANLGKRYEIQKRILEQSKIALDEATAKFGENSKEVQNAKLKHLQAREELAYYNNELKTTAAQLEKARASEEKYSDSLDKTANSLNKTQGGLEAAVNKINTLKQVTKQATEQFKALSQKLEAIGEKMQSIGTSLTQGVTLPIIGAGAMAIKSSVQFEDAFAGVKKTVDASVDGYNRLRDEILAMSKEMPQSATQIASVMEAAGQLGIENKHLSAFTKTMIQLGDSTNLSSQEAATQLSRFANITGMAQGNFSKLGSTIVALGNNFATTEREITEMGLRLAGAGRQVKLSEPQILAMATALSSVGIEAEAGGSAFSKLLINMQLATEKGGKDLSNFAKVSKLSGEEFATLFKRDAAGALSLFLSGLKDIEKSGGSTIGMLDEMGITEVRLRDAILRSAGASEMFKETLSLSSKAWEENQALTLESSKRYETTASKIEMLKNKFIALGIEVGDKLKPTLEGFIEKLQGLSSEQVGMIIKAAGTVAAIGPLLFGLGKLTSLFSGLSALVGVVGTISAPILLVVGAVALLGAGFALLYAKSENFRNSMNELGSFLKSNISREITNLKNEIEELGMTLDNSKGLIEGVGTALAPIAHLISKLLVAHLQSFVRTTAEILNGFSGIISMANGVSQVIHGLFTFNPQKILQGLKSIGIGAYNLLTSMIEVFITPIKGIASLFGLHIGSVRDILEGIIEFIKNAFASLIQTVPTLLSSLAGGIIDKIVALRESVIYIFEAIKNTVNDKVAQTVASAGAIFNGIIGAITAPINTARQLVSEGINRIKSLMNFTWSFPKLKLPHFKITGGFSLNPPKVPKLGVEWYAKGGIMTKPTAFGMNGNNIMVGGEKGAEAILPLSYLDKLVEDKMRLVQTENTNNLLAGVIAKLEMLIGKSWDVYLDSGELVGATIDKIDTALGKKEAKLIRGGA